MLRNQRGGLLVELLVATAVLGIFMGMFASMQIDYFKRFNQMEENTGDLASIRSIEEDIMRDERYILPQSTNTALDAATTSDDALENSFSIAAVQDRCYDVDGIRLKDEETECAFKVKLYRVAVMDKRLPAGDQFAKIPVSRLNIRVEYVKDKLAYAKDPLKKTDKVYITKLLTNVLPY